MTQLPIKMKYFRKAMVLSIFSAILAPFASIFLLVAGIVYAQSTQCQGLTNTVVFDTSFVNNPINAGTPFSVTLYKCNSSSQVDTSFNGVINLSDATNTMSPSRTNNFSNGVWNGTVTITRTAYPDTITAYNSPFTNGISPSFVVNPGNQDFLSLIGGSAQTGQVITTLSQGLTVKAIDQYGNPIPNIGVNFSIPGYPPGASGQRLSNYSVTTNFSGTASTSVTLGSKIGTYTINGSIGGGSNISSGVNFYENATSGPLSTLKISPLTSILPKGGTQPFSVTGTDQYGNPISLSSPTWSVVNGGGTIDSNGNFVSGTTPGVYNNTVKVSVGSVGAVASITVINENISDNNNPGSGSSGSSGGSSSGGGSTPTPTPIPSPLTTGGPYQPLSTASPTPTGPYQPLSNLKIDHVSINPNPAVVAAGGSVIVNAQAYDASNTPITDTQISWQLSAGAGTLAQSYGSSTSINAGTTPGNASITAVATDQSGSVQAQAQVIIQAVPLNQKILNTNIGGGHLLIRTIPSPQLLGVPFVVVVTAEDNNNNILGTFAGPISLADGTTTISPSTGDTFTNGVWTGNVTISKPMQKDIITIHGLGLSGTSNEFDVNGKETPNPLQNLGSGLKQVIVNATQNSSNSAKVLAAGIAAGLGLLGSSVSIGFMSARGLEAIGRNPFARTKIQVALSISLVLCLGIAILSIASAVLIK